MLTLHDGSRNYKNITPVLTGSSLPIRVKWVDILDGTSEEIAFIERAIGHHVPSLEELKEIETSSRLRFDRDAFCLSATVVSHIPSGMPKPTPIGFILARDLLVTVRFDLLTSFASFEEEFASPSRGFSGGLGAFVGLIDAIVDRSADVLESVGSELDLLSQNVFHGKGNSFWTSRRPARQTAGLREILRRIGYNGDLSSKIRNSLLSIGRAVAYVSGTRPEWFSTDLRSHLDLQHRDITSLSDYDVFLSNKVQLLLSATMGMINIEQNNIIKALTVVSVVGVPPTLVASMYGMNFKFMPELGWTLGYPFALVLILLSAVGPYIWFKVRGWL
ncbi:MAG: magnesium transporter CorA family protein [Bdellovibrionales bacterium]